VNGVNIDRIKGVLRSDEGLSLKPYRCPTGHRTIGYGWNLDARKLPNFIDFYLAQHGCITEEMAEWLLDRAVLDATEGAKSILGEAWSRLSEERREVLVQMVFQLGKASVSKFTTTLECIRNGEYRRAAEAMRQSLWHKQTPARCERLARVMEIGRYDRAAV